ncbi:MAG: hypothetical protein LBH13_03070, partial [Cellulomonadaceae bacterium]|nr:hypothetical protein [Cellulomonadaceae bacterium]
QEEINRRIALSDEIQKKLDETAEYVDWESSQAEMAHEELARKAQLVTRAEEELADATKEAEEAQARADQEGTAEAKDAAAAAHAKVATAKGLVADAKTAVEQARVAAEDQARSQREAEASAIAERYAQQEAHSENLQGVNPIPPEEMITTAAVNVRNGPGLGYVKTGELEANAKVTVNGEAYGFYRLTDGSFVSTQYLSSPSEAPTKPVKVTEEKSEYTWQTYVANIDHQAAVDKCAGGLTYSPDVSTYLGKDYYPIHNHCSGQPILSLVKGNTVEIKDLGVFVVVDTRDITKGDKAGVLQGMEGTILLQTCHNSGDGMRVVGLVRA